MPKTSTRGGKREGAGRKPNPGEQVTLYLSAALAAALRQTGTEPGPAALKILKDWRESLSGKDPSHPV